MMCLLVRCAEIPADLVPREWLQKVGSSIAAVARPHQQHEFEEKKNDPECAAAAPAQQQQQILYRAVFLDQTPLQEL